MKDLDIESLLFIKEFWFIGLMFPVPIENLQAKL